MGLGSSICLGGVVAVATHGTGVPAVAGALPPLGKTATGALSAATTGCSSCFTGILNIAEEGASQSLSPGAALGCLSCVTGVIAVARKKTEGGRLARKFQKLTPATEQSAVPTITPELTLKTVTRKRGLVRATEHGPVAYWQYGFEGDKPVLVNITHYEIDDLVGCKIILTPVTKTPWSPPGCALDPEEPPGTSSDLVPSPPVNEAFSMYPYISPTGDLPPFFCIWAPKKPKETPMFSKGVKFPDDYILFLVGERLQAATRSGSIGVACYHSMGCLATYHDPEECYFTLGYYEKPVPYTSIATTKKFPDEKDFTWLIEPDQEVLQKLRTQKAMPPLKDHLNDTVFFEWPFDWSRTSLKNIKFKVDPVPNSISTMPSINNNDRVYQYDLNVTKSGDPTTISLTGAVLSTAENGEGGSSCKAWRKCGDEWLLSGMHHGGMPNTSGFRNRMTDGQVLLQGIRKYEGSPWKPVYTRAFEEEFNSLAAHVSELIAAEDKFDVKIDSLQTDAGEFISFANESPLPIDERDAINAKYFELAINEGLMARSQWQKCMKRLHRKTGNHGLSKNLLYNSHSQSVAHYDPEAAKAAKKILDGIETIADLRKEYPEYVRALERQMRDLESAGTIGYVPHGQDDDDKPWYSDNDCPLPFNRELVLHKEVLQPTPRPAPGLESPAPTNTAPTPWQVLWDEYKTKANADLSPETAAAVAEAKKRKAEACKTMLPSIPEQPEENRGLLHAPCFGTNDSIIPHDVEFNPATESTDYSVINKQIGLDGCFPGYQRFYPLTVPQGPPEVHLPGGRVVSPADCDAALTPGELNWITSSDSVPFPQEHLPSYDEEYLERTDGCVPMPPASAKSREHFELVLKQLLDWNGGNYMSMTMETFGQIMSSVAGTLDGSLQDTEVFQKILGKQTQYEPREHNVQPASPVDPIAAKFVGLAPYAVNQKSKDWYYKAVKDGWFAEWADVCWDDVENRAAGACAARGPEPIRKSFNAQMKRKSKRKRGYSKKHLKEYSRGLPAPVWDGGQTLGEFLQEILKGVQAHKGTAWNKVTGEKLKGEWMEDSDNILSVLYRVLLKTATNHDLLKTCSPLDQFKAGLLVPEELFGKDEIHLNRKVDTDRLRVIWNAGVAEEIAVRFLHNMQNKLEIELFQAGETHSLSFPYFGSCPGMGHHDDGIKEMCGAMRNMLSRDGPAFAGKPNAMLGGKDLREHNGVSTDASGWDISVTRALWMADAWRRADAARFGYYPYGWCYALMNLGLTLSSHVVVIGKEMFEVRWFGVMPSGIPSTSASNSFMRGFVHSEAIWTTDGVVGISLNMGDDNHSKDKLRPIHMRLWKDLGVIIEESGETLGAEEPVPFTSHLYDLDADAATFDNGPKILLRLAYHSNKPLTKDQATGIRFAVRNTPGLREKVDNFVAAQPNGKLWLAVDIHDPNVVMDFTTTF